MENENINLNIGKNIKQYRLLHNLSQEDVAFSMNTSVSVLSKLERGGSCRIETFVKLVNSLQTTPNTLLKGLYDFPNNENITKDLQEVFLQYNITDAKAQQTVIDILNLLKDK